MQLVGSAAPVRGVRVAGTLGVQRVRGGRRAGRRRAVRRLPAPGARRAPRPQGACS